MSKYINIKVLSIVIIIASMMFFITDVFAQGIGYNNTNHPTPSVSSAYSKNNVTPTGDAVSPNPSNKGLSKKPTNAISHACFGRTLAIKNRSSNLIKLINTTVSKFSTITSRVEQYYQNTLFPSGKTLPNYNLLINTISQNKDNVLAMQTTIDNEYNNFTCTNVKSFKTETQSFNKNLINTLNLLKTYRSSIIALIVALKSA
ncbi:hypothetical protein M1145_01655 [Patescibacteria group bacterium]|nr:hypothetical protein [Patescibacteria group bacterium]